MLLHLGWSRAKIPARAPKICKTLLRVELPFLGSSWSQTSSLCPANPAWEPKHASESQQIAPSSQGTARLRKRQSTVAPVGHLMAAFWSPTPKQQPGWLCSEEFECDLPVACWSHRTGLLGAYLHLAAGVTGFSFFRGVLQQG